MANHHSHHGHDHGDHSHHRESIHQEAAYPAPQPHASYNKLLISFWIISLFMAIEILGGWLFHSLALMSDGFHMLSDAVSLGLSAFAVSLSTRKATVGKTFGFKRFEILAAFGNGLTLILLSVFIAVQAAIRLAHPEPVAAKPMLIVASLGLLVNLAVAWWLHRGETEKTLNEESAFLHVLGDLGGSLIAIAAALLIMSKGWLWADPALSLALALAIAFAGWRVMRRSGHILVEGTPEGVKFEAVRSAILANKQVHSVHDLHMWTMNGRDVYLSAHVETVAGESNEKAVTASLTHSLTRDFRVNHITLQVGQCAEGDCFNNCESV